MNRRRFLKLIVASAAGLAVPLPAVALPVTVPGAPSAVNLLELIRLRREEMFARVARDMEEIFFLSAPANSWEGMHELATKLFEKRTESEES